MAMIVVQFPAIQTTAAKRAAEMISKKIDGDVSIGKVCYAPLNRIILNDITVREKTGDTILHLGKVLADVKVLSVLDGDIKINRVSLSDGEFNLRNTAPDTTNLSLLLASLSPVKQPGEAEKETSDQEKKETAISVNTIMLNNIDFSMVNPFTPQTQAVNSATAIEWNNLALKEISLYANNFTLNEDGIAVHLDKLSFREGKGLNVQDLSGDVKLSTLIDSTMFFVDTLQEIRIDNLHLQDDFSDINANYLSMKMDSFADFSDFLNKVEMGLDLDDAFLDFNTLHFFAPGIDALKLQLHVTGEAIGPVSNLRSKSLKVYSGSKQTYLAFAFHLSGLPNANETMASFEIDQCFTTTKDLETIINQVTPKPLPKNTIAKFAPGEKFTFKGSLNGFFEDFVAYGALESANLGGVDVDIICRNDRQKGYEIIGHANSNAFDLGEFLQNESFDKLSCNATLSATMGKKNVDLLLESLKVTDFGFNNYNYSNITAVGRLNNKEFDGRVICSDPNLNFMFHGLFSLAGKNNNSLYKFNLSLGYANLHALNFDKRDISQIQLRAEANIKQTATGDIFGDAVIKDLRGTVANNNVNVGDIKLRSLSSNNKYLISLTSGLATANYSGTAPVSTFIEDILNLTLNEELSHLVKGEVKKSAADYSQNNYTFKLDTYDMKPLCDFFMPELYVADSTKIRLNLDRSGNLDGEISSELIALKDKYIKGLNINLDNQGGSLNTAISADILQSGDLIAKSNVITASADSNNVDFEYVFGDNNLGQNRADIRALVTFPSKEEGNHTVICRFKPSELVFNGAEWNIEPCSIYYKPNSILVNNFALCNGDQSLRADGIISDSPSDSVDVLLNKFDLSLVNTIISMPLNIQGLLSGRANAFGLLGEDMGLLVDIDGDSLAIAGKELGTLKLLSKWDDTNERFNVLINNKLNGNNPLNVVAGFTPKSKEIHASASLKEFGLSYFEPILSTIVSDISGSLSGDIEVSGSLDKLKIDSKDGAFNDLHCKLLFTQVPYTLNGPFEISEKGVKFNNVVITDKYGHSGRVTGGVEYDCFKDIKLNTRISVTDILALNTTAADNSTFYGRAFGTGLIRLTGPADNILLDINVTTKNNSNIHIPLGSATKEQVSLLTFVNNKVERLSAYDSLLIRNEEIKVAKKSEFGVKIRVNATPDAEVHLEINKSLGDVLKSRGSGLIDITAGTDLFDIKGNYSIDEGSYKFVLMGLAARDFSINPGGTINFNGDIMQSDLNLTATYRTKASISTLISDTTSVGTRRNVDCGIGITGKIANPQLNFSIDIPDLDPNTKDKVESALNTEDKRLKQVLTLLLSGSFIPDEQSSIVNNTAILYSNASEIMANQLNNIFRQLDIPLDLGFNYQPGQNGRDIFDVAISTQLFNNRVTINGNIGNRQYMSTSNSDLVGDVDVEIKLNESGKIRLNLFSHSADQFSNYLDQTQRNGAGILYQEEFDDFKELWRKIFWKKSRREEYEREQRRQNRQAITRNRSNNGNQR